MAVYEEIPEQFEGRALTRHGTERLLEEAARRIALAARPAAPGEASDAPRWLDPRALIERLRPFQSMN